MNYWGRLLSLLVVCASVSLATPALAADLIRDIRVEGNQRLEPDTVKTYLGLKVGDSTTQYDLDTALKKLYDTGFFADVGLNQEGGVLTVNVVENASINEVLFEGNDKIDKDDLDKEITLKARAVYTRTKVQNDLKRLLDVYRRHGYYSAEITPQIIQLEQNRVNLIYNITEGPKAFIEKITFIGNETYPGQTLEKIINSSQERWYQFLSDSDKYDPDRLQYDQELLRKYYFENGYADFKVKSAIAELSPQRDAFYLTFTIEEGEQYKLGKVNVVSKLDKGHMPDLQPSISTKAGDVYNATEVEDSINRMTDVLGDHGFAFVEITPDVQRRPGKEKIVDLTYNVTEGPKVYVDRINIFGNQRTLDEVIRREFKLSEGDAYSSSKLKRTEQRLNNLGYFDKVNIDRKPGPTPDTTDINVEVAEKSTGEITLGAGYSTTDGPIADFGVKEKNFLGSGQEVHARVEIGGNIQQYDVGFNEPYFLGRELGFGVDLFKTEEDYQDNSSFDRDTLGVTTKLTYALSEHMQHELRYTLEDIKIDNVSSDASQYIVQQEGQDTVSMVGQSFIYDMRDNKFNPTTGYSWKFSQDLAGFGGDDRFLRDELQGEYYVPVAKKWTMAFLGGAGNVFGLNQDVRINQRYFAGGQYIRGFANAGLGARDSATGDALGSNNYYAGTEELRFPLGLPDDLGVTGAFFVDEGSAFGIDTKGVGIQDSSAMRAALGFGIAWASPFGPIRIDFAEPFLKQPYDDTEFIRFNFGTRF